MRVEPYLFYGVVLPERAQLSLGYSLEFSHIASGVTGKARVSIVLNQVAVWVDSDHAWDFHDLRNVVLTIVQSHLAMVGYLRGYAYDCEITRVVNREREIDWVFGIDVPCLAGRVKSDLDYALSTLRAKTTGVNGVYLNRCFADLVSAIKHADDTGFYCYRAIESLRHHCAEVNGLAGDDKAKQWAKFRSVAGCDEQTLREIKAAADPVRHGRVATEVVDRARLFKITWDVADGYLNAIP
jgi:hypothetical protein